MEKHRYGSERLSRIILEETMYFDVPRNPDTAEVQYAAEQAVEMTLCVCGEHFDKSDPGELERHGSHTQVRSE